MNMNDPVDRAAFTVLDNAAQSIPPFVPHIIMVQVPKPRQDEDMARETFMVTNLAREDAAHLLREMLAKLEAGAVTLAVPNAAQGDG